MHVDREKGYSWFFFSMTRARALSLLVVILGIGVGGAFYIWYKRFGAAPYPFGTVGIGYGIAGTICLILAALLYTLRRRSRKRAVGQLNAGLQWHIGFAVLGLALLFMHSFGYFNPISGTYAFLGMLALVISGFVGRVLDSFLPRLIAREVKKALTEQGEDRVETISQRLQAITVHNPQQEQTSSTGTRAQRKERSPAPDTSPLRALALQATQRNQQGKQPLLTSWDLAYISLEETPQELRQDGGRQPRFISDKKSPLTRPDALIAGAQEQIATLRDVQRALRREQLYRHIIRYWRILHVVLALLTIGLTIWHIIFVTELFWPVWLHLHR